MQHEVAAVTLINNICHGVVRFSVMVRGLSRIIKGSKISST